jgi:hypothetical protein
MSLGNNNFFTRSLLISLVAPCLITVGCKKPDAGRLKSLDNFAAGKNIHRNVCQAPSDSLKQERMTVAKEIPVFFSGAKAKANEAKLKSALFDTLAALPREYLAAYASAGGQFSIGDAVQATCTELFKKSTRQGTDVESCHVLVNESGKSRISILLPADEVIIRHDTVKAVGLAYSESLSRYHEESKGKVKLLNDKSNSQYELERVLVNSFLYDLYLLNHKGIWSQFVTRYFDIENAEKLAKYFKETKLGAQLASKDDVVSKLKFQSEASSKELFGLVFAHTWDSAYCNRSASFDVKKAAEAFLGNSMSAGQRDIALKNTFKVMEQFFPVTGTSFKNLEPEMLKYAKYVYAISGGKVNTKSSTNESASGFQLDQPSVYDVAARWMDLDPNYRNVISSFNNSTQQRYDQGASIYNGWGPNVSGWFTNADNSFATAAPRLNDGITIANQINASRIPENERVPFLRYALERYRSADSGQVYGSTTTTNNGSQTTNVGGEYTYGTEVGASFDPATGNVGSVSGKVNQGGKINGTYGTQSGSTVTVAPLQGVTIDTFNLPQMYQSFKNDAFFNPNVSGSGTQIASAGGGIISPEPSSSDE